MKKIEVKRVVHEGYKELENTPYKIFGKYQYIYTSGKGKISLIKLINYFRDGKDLWEIYCLEGELFDDVERFDTKKEAVITIKNYLSNKEKKIKKITQSTPEEKYKKGDKVKLTLADKDGWITGEFEVAGVEVEQPEEKKTLEQIREVFDKERVKEWDRTAMETYKQATQDTPEDWEEDFRGFLDFVIEDDSNKKEVVEYVKNLLSERERKVLEHVLMEVKEEDLVDKAVEDYIEGWLYKLKLNKKK